MAFTESAILKKVRNLIAIAEHPNTPPAEAALAAEKADDLMIKYAVDEAVARSAVGVEARSKPGTMMIQLGSDEQLLAWMASVAGSVATHLRCKIRHYVEYDYKNKTWMSKVYGFEHDLRFFEVLYTTIRLHMIDALRPKWDPALSMDENCFVLHGAGFNWLQIAELRGWHKRTLHEKGFEFDDPRYGKECWIGPDGELKTNWQLGSMHKRAYQNACKAKGVETQVIAAGGTDTYRSSAAQGYANRISQRLRRQREGQSSEPGVAIVLRDAFSDVEKFFRDENPDLFAQHVTVECEKCKKAKSGHCRDHPRGSYRERPFSQAGYSAGTARADTADLMAGGRVSKSAKAVR